MTRINKIKVDLDLGQNQIVNLPYGITGNSPARLQDLAAVSGALNLRIDNLSISAGNADIFRVEVASISSGLNRDLLNLDLDLQNQLRLVKLKDLAQDLNIVAISGYNITQDVVISSISGSLTLISSSVIDASARSEQDLINIDLDLQNQIRTLKTRIDYLYLYLGV